MGLSILIPVFNFDVTLLVNDLSDQLKQSVGVGEIVLIDDGSDASFEALNKPLSHFPFVKYSRNVVNTGRTATRKLLAESAQNDYLLFLDCDSKIIKDNFLQVYFEQIDFNEQLVCGGRIYSPHAPEKCSLHLHWKYGSIRESINKKKKNGPAFMSHNFLVNKSLFLKLNFRDLLNGYGHEDSFWGIQFRQMDIIIKQINNPVLHNQLEEADDFINKSNQALNNLLVMAKLVDGNYLKSEIKIYRWYKRLQSIGLASIFSLMERPFHSLMHSNLVSCKPSLIFFDLYRLALLIRMTGKK